MIPPPHRLAAALGLGLVLGPLAAASSPALREFLDAHLAQSQFAAATWGVKIVSLDSGATLYEHNAGKLLKPASNAKLYSTALALDRLGPDFRIRTSLLARQPPDPDGVVHGDLIIYGRGDPSFAARFHHGSHADNLSPLSRALARAGVKRVTGDLVADETFFRGPPLGSGWMWDDLDEYYGAEVSALTVEDNVVDLVLRPGAAAGDPVLIQTLPPTRYLAFSNLAVTVNAGSGPAQLRLHRPLARNLVLVEGRIPLDVTNLFEAATVHQPARWFAALFRESLERQGIRVEGTLRAIDSPLLGSPVPGNPDPVELAFVESPPLSEILARTLKPSQNLYAQLLLLQVGARAQAAAPQRAPGPVNGRLSETTEAAGLLEMNRFLADAGIGPEEVRLEEGSGLSRGTLLTPNATVKLLAHMHRHRHRETFREALPVAGVDGTLRRRMKGTPAAGNARAKTGTLRYMHTLSGYATNQIGETLAFSLMLNNFTGEESAARDALDAIVVRLCGDRTPP